jgi:ribosomal protein L37AE/L43A
MGDCPNCGTMLIFEVSEGAWICNICGYKIEEV